MRLYVSDIGSFIHIRAISTFLLLSVQQSAISYQLFHRFSLLLDNKADHYNLNCFKADR